MFCRAGVLECRLLRCWTALFIQNNLMGGDTSNSTCVQTPHKHCASLFGNAVKVDQRSEETECSGGGSAAASRQLATQQITPVALVHSGHDVRAAMEAAMKGLQPFGAGFGGAITATQHHFHSF